MHILFVNCCISQKTQPRTLMLCRTFIQAYCKHHPEDTVEELSLLDTDLSFFDAQKLDERDGLLSAGKKDAPYFTLANQFAGADKIIIGAPYWDLSFPALLKIYFENISVNKIAYHYTEHGLQGLCRAKSLLYVTTSGGFIGENHSGGDYIHDLCNMFGIGRFDMLSAQGLDIEGADVQGILARSFEQAQALAQSF